MVTHGITFSLPSDLRLSPFIGPFSFARKIPLHIYIIQNKVRFHNVLCISSTGFTVIYRSSGVYHFNMASLHGN